MRKKANRKRKCKISKKEPGKQGARPNTHTHTLNTYNNWRKQYQSGVVAAGWNWCYKI